MSATETVAVPKHIPRPGDACHAAAFKTNVILRLLNEHDCAHRDEADDEGGYDIAIVCNLLREIRDTLRTSAETHPISGGAK